MNSKCSVKKCMRPVAKSIPENENTKKLCRYHFGSRETPPKPEQNFNDVCPICLEEETPEMKLHSFSCSHKAHLSCLDGMTKMECPICRAEINNLPAKIINKIRENGEKYEEEIERENEQAFLEMMREEGALASSRLPPQMELVLALKYVFQLGIPIYFIPMETILELDPSSPLPAPGSIFQNAVKHILESISQRVNSVVEEDDYDETESSTDEEPTDEDNPFHMEGDDLQIVHRVRTVLPRRTGTISTINFRIATLPELTQEDLLNLQLGEFNI